MLAKLKLRALVRAPIRSPNCVFTSPFQVQQERKKAGWLASRPGLLFNAGFVGELAGKRVCHGNYGPNPQKAGHLGCLGVHTWVPEPGSLGMRLGQIVLAYGDPYACPQNLESKGDLYISLSYYPMESILKGVILKATNLTVQGVSGLAG